MDRSSQTFTGLTFAVHPDDKQDFEKLQITDHIVGGDGGVVAFEGDNTVCTHVIARHRQQECFAWAEQHGKTAVSALWVWESAVAGQLLPLDDPLYTPYPGPAIPGAGGCQVTLTGFTGDLRGHLLELMACMGVRIQKAMDPYTISHVVAADVECRDSQKLNIARGFQAHHQIWLLNCLWMYDSIRHWRMQEPDTYMANPSPAMDPVKGHTAAASLPAELAGSACEVPNSQDDDAVLSQPPTRPAGALDPTTGVGWHIRRQAALQATPAAPGMPTPPAAEVHPASAHAAAAGAGVARGVQKGGGGPRQSRTGAAGASGAAELPQSFYTASASQVPDCQVAAANAATSRLIAELATSASQGAEPAWLTGDGRAAHGRPPKPDPAGSRLTGEAGDADEAALHAACNLPNDGQPPAPRLQEDAPPQEPGGSSVRKRKGGRGAKPLGDPPKGKKRKLLSKAAGAAALQTMKALAGGGPADPAPPCVAPGQPDRGADAGTRRAGHKSAGRKKSVQQPLKARQEHRSNLPAPRSTPAARQAAAGAPGQELTAPASKAAAPLPSPMRSPRPASARRMFVALSGMHTDDCVRYSALLHDLGVGHVDGRCSHLWDARVTHVVAPTLRRGAKTLAAMAAGNWLLSTSFLTASAAARCFVEPDEHELDVHGSPQLSEGTPCLWRLRAQQLGVLAFDRLRVCVQASFSKGYKPERSELVSILRAGGATVLTVAQGVAQGADLAILLPSKPRADPEVKELLKARIACATPQYIVDWLAHPAQSLDTHLLHRSREGPKLADMVTDRKKSPDDMEQSCSL